MVTVHGIFYFLSKNSNANSYKLTNVETQSLASLLFDQKLTDRDAKHCVSTLGLAIQIRI
ncbi:MAG: hypothetical protein LBB88_04820 [Planctomycetaceae bacterium]|nr:hypothetical protein [Planctomycetaceae bacterium]